MRAHLFVFAQGRGLIHALGESLSKLRANTSQFFCGVFEFQEAKKGLLSKKAVCQGIILWKEI
jgi:hypothetical protein